jgi:hypothetical protein
MRWLFILAACFLLVMLVEEVPAQEIEPVIIYGPQYPTGIVCIEVSPGMWDCQ